MDYKKTLLQLIQLTNKYGFTNELVLSKSRELDRIYMNMMIKQEGQTVIKETRNEKRGRSK
ncbi:hypothetical protein RZN22_13160 [Bacillaceae bacterium S4-13-58]